MALKINYSKNGVAHVGAYAKIGNLSFSNLLKQITFGVIVYASKEAHDANVNDFIDAQAYSATIPSTGIEEDFVKQCYDSISARIANLDESIARLEADIAATEDEQKKASLQGILASYQREQVFIFKGAEVWQ